MSEELYNINTNAKMYGSDENYEEVCTLRRQITHAVFADEADAILSGIVANCSVFPENTEAYIHKKYVELERRVRE